MAPDRRARVKRSSMTPEEILAKAFKRKCRFKAIVRYALANKYWLEDFEDEELGDDVHKNVILLMRKKEKRGLTMMDKSIMLKPTSNRTEADKLHLNRVIGGLKCFRRYPPHVKSELAGVTYFVYYGPGRDIVHQGDVADSLYFIISGEIVITQLVFDPILDTHINQEVGRRGPGAMFGEVSLLHGIRRTATITTATHCELLRLRKDDFEVVLRDTVQHEWDNIFEAMGMFSYFKDWDSIARRECCILSKIRDFNVDETILGDGVGSNDYVYFIIKGTCRIIHHLMVIPYIHHGKQLYKLYDPKAHVFECESSSFLRFSSIFASQLEIKSKLIEEADDENRETKNAQASMKIAEKLSTANLPHNVEVHFMQVCFLHKTACFGVGEMFEHRRVVAATNVQCLLIPRYWLYQRNICNVWSRVIGYLDSHIPTNEEVFREFLNQRRWLKHRRQMINNFMSSRKSLSHALHSDVPLYHRVLKKRSYKID